ncbi:MAG TPA: cation-translocating P-type ATPase [Clostridiales bacterium]|nr:cation-translocating P-type ATPase [Clostridiales bacterium]
MWYQKTIAETEQLLGTSQRDGLTKREHDRRLERNGGNVLKEEKRVSVPMIFLRQFGDFMVMVLMAAAVVSAFLGENLDAIMILLIIVMNGILGFIQEYKAERSLEALKKMTEDEARIVVGGELFVTKAENLVVGDVVILDSGTKVPADLRITESFRLKVEESVLTGEAQDVSKHADPLTEEVTLNKRKNMCYSGTVVTGGRGRGIVVATGMNTEIGHIAGMLQTRKTEPTPLQRQLKHLGKILICFCAVVCAMVAVAGFFLGGDLYTMILTGISLGVASIPEGLPIVVTICLALGVWRLANVNAIVRRLPAVEALGCTTCICTDKTGTLTKNSMETQYLYGDGTWHEVEVFRQTEKTAFYTNMVIANCNSLYQEGDTFYGDSTETALMLGAQRTGAPLPKVKKLDEISFDSSRKMMSVLGEYEGKNYALVKGAPDRISSRCRYMLRQGKVVPFGYEEKNAVNSAVAAYGGNGFRILAMAFRPDVDSAGEMEKDLIFLSLAALSDPLREDAKPALSNAKKAGIRSIMVTGDHCGTALAIGRELGIASSAQDVLTGEQLQAMDDGALARRLRGTSVIASVSPADKMRVVSVLKRQNEVCAMTGDGVNDAPALKEADIGIAMGLKGTDVTKGVADFILADDNFSSIVEAVYQGRGIYDNIRKSVRYLLSSNFGEILLMVIAVWLQFPLPLIPLQILWVNLVTDGLPALALAMEPPHAGLMQEKPRKRQAGIFSNGLGAKIALRGFLIGAICFALFLYGIYVTEDIATARTMAFNALVLSQLFYVFDCRSEKGVLWGKAFFGNPFLLVTVALSLVVQWFVLYHGFFNQLFGTVPLSTSNLLFTVALSAMPSFFVLLKGMLTGKRNEKK